MADEKLRRLQLIQLDMLKIVDGICREYNIRYSLYAGTLLGAVRHKGFIPWDDDLDICMPRRDYNRFLKICEKNLPEGYAVQNKENEPKFTQSFTKIRKDHTTYLQVGEPDSDYNHGIFIDIFPVDRIPDKVILKYIFWWNCMKYQLLTREFLPLNCSWFVKIIAKIYLVATPPERRMGKRKKLLKKLTAFNHDTSLSMVSTETINVMTRELPNDLFEKLISLPYEDGNFSSFSKWHHYLEINYQDYMVFPPREEQTWKHLPQVIDFDYALDEIKKII